MSRARVCAALAFAASVALGGLGAVAWACFPMPVVSVAPQASGPPGSEITVKGVDFGAVPIEVRWNALDGPKLADGTGPHFSVPVRIPDAPDGVYSLVALGRTPDGAANTKASAAFAIGNGDLVGGAPRQPPSSDASSDAGNNAGVGTIAGLALAVVVLSALSGVAGARLSSRRGDSSLSMAGEPASGSAQSDYVGPADGAETT